MHWPGCWWVRDAKQVLQVFSGMGWPPLEQPAPKYEDSFYPHGLEKLVKILLWCFCMHQRVAGIISYNWY